MLVLLCRQGSTDCQVTAEAGVGTVSIQNKNAALSLLPLHRQTYGSYIEHKTAATHGHPCTDLANPGVVLWQLYMCLNFHHRLL